MHISLEANFVDKDKKKDIIDNDKFVDAVCISIYQKNSMRLLVCRQLAWQRQIMMYIYLWIRGRFSISVKFC